MDDLMAKLGELLNSPEGIRQLNEAASMLGLNDDTQAPAEQKPPQQEAPSLDLSALSGLLAGLGDNGAETKPEKPPAPALPSFDLNTIRTIQKAMEMFGTDDKNTLLLKALKPHLHEERSKKVDEAIRIMQLLKLAPLLKETGLFSDLL